MRKIIASVLIVAALSGCAMNEEFCPFPKASKTANFLALVGTGMILGGVIGGVVGGAIVVGGHVVGTAATSTVLSNGAVGMGGGAALGASDANYVGCGIKGEPKGL